MSFNISQVLNISTPVIRGLNPNTPPQRTITPVNFWISDWIELLLKKVAQNNLGPTVTTRWLFLTVNSIYNSYQYVIENKTPVDSFYWESKNKGKISNDPSYTISWIENSCKYFIPILIKNYMKISLNDSEVGEIINNHSVLSPLLPIDKDSFNNLKSLLDSYLSKRDDDGWKDSLSYNVSLPNGNSVIHADNSIEENLNDMSLIPHPNKWTPLMINGTKKNYLTPGWGTTNKGILDDNEFKDIRDKTQSLFPSDDQYESEMEDVYNITNNLDDKQKIEAEFWAGGPGTVTPPGMWVVFLDIVIRSNNINYINELKYYVILCSGLYQAGISAWRLKLDNLQARPIQKLRQYKYGEDIKQEWNQKDKGQYWLPYQELNFVTPPFPDFVSGHSTFSSSSAKLFCYMLKTDVINLNNPVVNNNILSLLSPIFKENVQNFSLNNFHIMPNSSTISQSQKGAVNLSWMCWTEMARSSGKSRIYGGIHVESSNQAGLFLGSMIGDKIWNLLKNL